MLPSCQPFSYVWITPSKSTATVATSATDLELGDQDAGGSSDQAPRHARVPRGGISEAQRRDRARVVLQERRRLARTAGAGTRPRREGRSHLADEGVARRRGNSGHGTP